MKLINYKQWASSVMMGTSFHQFITHRLHIYPLITEDELSAGYTLPQDGLLDIYVHIPFCERHCTFCHYPVKVGQPIDGDSRASCAVLDTESGGMEILRLEYDIEAVCAKIEEKNTPCRGIDRHSQAGY